jgi:periplasmic protein TonB
MKSGSHCALEPLYFALKLKISGAGGRAMPVPGLQFDSALSRRSSFLKRICENLESVLRLRRVAMAAAHAAIYTPIHLSDERRDHRSFNAQAGSTCAHALILAGLIYLAAHPLVKIKPVLVDGSVALGPVEFATPKWLREAARNSAGKKGGGGDHNPLPAPEGELAPPAKIVLAPPRLPDGRPHPLAVQSTTYDAEAPELVTPVKDLGLPWMKDPNNSAGPGINGIGTRPGHGMGDDPGDGSGQGDDALPYARVATEVVCLHCPDPAYSDEARKAKLQGLVMMRVLVGADGRVRDVQVTRGIGLGLDENAARAVRNWQFRPAKDAARKPVASWITIETVFRLY